MSSNLFDYGLQADAGVDVAAIDSLTLLKLPNTQSDFSSSIYGSVEDVEALHLPSHEEDDDEIESYSLFVPTKMEMSGLKIIPLRPLQGREPPPHHRLLVFFLMAYYRQDLSLLSPAARACLQGHRIQNMLMTMERVTTGDQNYGTIYTIYQKSNWNSTVRAFQEAVRSKGRMLDVDVDDALQTMSVRFQEDDVQDVDNLVEAEESKRPSKDVKLKEDLNTIATEIAFFTKRIRDLFVDAFTSPAALLDRLLASLTRGLQKQSNDYKDHQTRLDNSYGEIRNLNSALIQLYKGVNGLAKWDIEVEEQYKIRRGEDELIRTNNMPAATKANCILKEMTFSRALEDAVHFITHVRSEPMADVLKKMGTEPRDIADGGRLTKGIRIINDDIACLLRPQHCSPSSLETYIREDVAIICRDVSERYEKRHGNGAATQEIRLQDIFRWMKDLLQDDSCDEETRAKIIKLQESVLVTCSGGSKEMSANVRYLTETIPTLKSFVVQVTESPLPLIVSRGKEGFLQDPTHPCSLTTQYIRETDHSTQYALDLYADNINRVVEMILGASSLARPIRPEHIMAMIYVSGPRNSGKSVATDAVRDLAIFIAETFSSISITTTASTLQNQARLAFMDVFDDSSVNNVTGGTPKTGDESLRKYSSLINNGCSIGDDTSKGSTMKTKATSGRVVSQVSIQGADLSWKTARRTAISLGREYYLVNGKFYSLSSAIQSRFQLQPMSTDSRVIIQGFAGVFYSRLSEQQPSLDHRTSNVDGVSNLQKTSVSHVQYLTRLIQSLGAVRWYHAANRNIKESPLYSMVCFRRHFEGVRKRNALFNTFGDEVGARSNTIIWDTAMGLAMQRSALLGMKFALTELTPNIAVSSQEFTAELNLFNQVDSQMIGMAMSMNLGIHSDARSAVVGTLRRILKLDHPLVIQRFLEMTVDEMDAFILKEVEERNREMLAAARTRLQGAANGKSRRGKQEETLPTHLTMMDMFTSMTPYRPPGRLQRISSDNDSNNASVQSRREVDSESERVHRAIDRSGLYLHLEGVFPDANKEDDGDPMPSVMVYLTEEIRKAWKAQGNKELKEMIIEQLYAMCVRRGAGSFPLLVVEPGNEGSRLKVNTSIFDETHIISAAIEAEEPLSDPQYMTTSEWQRFTTDDEGITRQSRIVRNFHRSLYAPFVKARKTFVVSATSSTPGLDRFKACGLFERMCTPGGTREREGVFIAENHMPGRSPVEIVNLHLARLNLSLKRMKVRPRFVPVDMTRGERRRFSTILFSGLLKSILLPSAERADQSHIDCNAFNESERFGTKDYLEVIVVVSQPQDESPQNIAIQVMDQIYSAALESEQVGAHRVEMDIKTRKEYIDIASRLLESGHLSVQDLPPSSPELRFARAMKPDGKAAYYSVFVSRFLDPRGVSILKPVNFDHLQGRVCVDPFLSSSVQRPAAERVLSETLSCREVAAHLSAIWSEQLIGFSGVALQNALNALIGRGVFEKLSTGDTSHTYPGNARFDDVSKVLFLDAFYCTKNVFCAEMNWEPIAITDPDDVAEFCIHIANSKDLGRRKQEPTGDELREDKYLLFKRYFWNRDTPRPTFFSFIQRNMDWVMETSGFNDEVKISNHVAFFPISVLFEVALVSTARKSLLTRRLYFDGFVRNAAAGLDPCDGFTTHIDVLRHVFDFGDGDGFLRAMFGIQSMEQLKASLDSSPYSALLALEPEFEDSEFEYVSRPMSQNAYSAVKLVHDVLVDIVRVNCLCALVNFGRQAASKNNVNANTVLGNIERWKNDIRLSSMLGLSGELVSIIRCCDAEKEAEHDAAAARVFGGVDIEIPSALGTNHMRRMAYELFSEVKDIILYISGQVLLLMNMAFGESKGKNFAQRGIDGMEKETLEWLDQGNMGEMRERYAEDPDAFRGVLFARLFHMDESDDGEVACIFENYWKHLTMRTLELMMFSSLARQINGVSPVAVQAAVMVPKQSRIGVEDDDALGRLVDTWVGNGERLLERKVSFASDEAEQVASDMGKLYNNLSLNARRVQNTHGLPVFDIPQFEDECDDSDDEKDGSHNTKSTGGAIDLVHDTDDDSDSESPIVNGKEEMPWPTQQGFKKIRLS